MKKLILTPVLVLALALFAGCGEGGLFSSADNREKLAQPVCILADDYLYWSPVENAVSYTVSVNGKEQPAQALCGFDLDVNEELSVKVRANAAEGSDTYKNSAYTAAILRSADPSAYVRVTESVLNEHASVQNGKAYAVASLSGESSAYELDFSGYSGEPYLFRIPAEVRAVRVHGGDTVLHAGFCVLTRTDPLILELNGANIQAPDDMCAVWCESMTALPGTADLIVRSVKNGDFENSLSGGDNSKDGETGKKGSGFPGEGGKGGKGNPGYAAISVPAVVFSGDLSLSVYGGNGSDGGRGGEAAWYGQGGGGGGGGGGAGAGSGETLYLNMSGGQELRLIGGAGGSRGELGSGNNGLSTNHGKNGSSGTGYAGTPVVIRGMLG